MLTLIIKRNNRANKILIAVVLLVFLLCISLASAANAGPLSNRTSTDIIALVNEQYIPQTIRELTETGQISIAALWQGAEAGTPLLQWVLDRDDLEIVPLNWVVPVVKRGVTLGLIGVDPSKADFMWRIERIDDEFPPLDAQDAKNLLQAQTAGNSNVDLDDAKVVMINKKNYWVFPIMKPQGILSADVGSYLTIPLYGQQEIKTIDQLLTEAPAPGYRNFNDTDIPTTEPMAHLKAPSLTRTGQDIIVASTPPSSYTWMRGKVPYYYQGGHPWCGLYSLAMVHQWWSSSQLGTGDYQAGEVADYQRSLGDNPDDGITVAGVEKVMKNWHEVNNNYTNWQWTWYGEMKSLEDSGTSYTNDDIKGVIAAHVPVIVAMRHDTSVSEFDHFRVALGYTSTGIYIHDPAGWTGWAYGYDAWVSNATFTSLWDVRWRFPWETRGGIVGYPGDYDLSTTSIAVSGVPSSVMPGSTFQITIALENTGSDSATANSGVHIRLENAEFYTSPTWSSGWGSYQAYDQNANPIGINGAKILEIYANPLNGGSKIYAYVNVRATGPSDVIIRYRSWLSDVDDRGHCGVHTITIDDDRNLAGGPNTIAMPRVESWIERDPDDVNDDGKGFLEYLTHQQTSNCDGPSAAPSLSSPSNGSSTCDTTPTFSWNSVSGASSYRIQVDNNSNFSSPEIDTTTSNNTSTPSSSLSAGTYYWRVRASNACGDSNWSSTWNVTINSTPSAPSLSSPSNGSSTCDTTPTFSWGSVNGATSYRLQVDNNSNFSSPEIDTTTSSTSYTPSSSLSLGTYYWQVRASNACGDGNWSSTWSFTIITVPGVPILSSPANGSSTTNRRPTFSWGSVSGASSYRIQVDNNSDFSSPVIDASTSNTSHTPSSDLADGTYYWRVRASNDCGDGNWSATWSVTVAPCIEPPPPPSLSSPSNGSSTCDTTPTFSWGSVSGASSYRLQVDNNSNFSSPEIDTTTSSTSYTPSSSLSPGTYYWRVRASNACGDSNWSSTWNFTIITIPGVPTLSSPANGSSTSNRRPTFSWGSVSGASSYRIQVDNNSDFSSPVIDASTSNTSHTPSSDLADGTYYWRVRASNDCGDGNWSAVWSVIVTPCIEPPPPPSLSSPSNGSSTCDTTPTFSWGSVNGTTSYRLQVDNNSNFSSPEIDTTTSSTSYTPSSSLSLGTYYWRVRASNACGDGNWSSTWSFTIITVPGVPILSSPANGSSTTNRRPTFSWGSVSGASSYRIQVDNNSDFSSPVIDATTSSTSYTPSLDLADGTYSWRVRASNDCGDGNWSATWSVTIGGVAADILLVDDDSASYETYYQNALSANGYSFDNWNVASQGSPPLSTLQSYSIVVWFTGDDWSTTLTDTDQANLQAYLDGGGNLFISGQDIGYDLTENGSVANAFFTDYLHASYVQDSILDGVNYWGVRGVSGDPIGDGLDLFISGGDGADNQNWPSEIDPLSPAVTVLNYSIFFVSPPASSPEAIQKREKAEPRDSQRLRMQGISSSGAGAIRACTQMYKVVYFAFGFEAINSATDRNTIMDRVIGWLSSYCRHPDCFGDFDCDCEVTVQDIQQIANRWRMTEADDDWDPWYDLNDDGIITVVDIMLVVAHWGERCESALLYVLTEDGIVEVSLTGSKRTIIGAHGESHSIEILNNELYVSEETRGGDILVYDLQGNYLKTIPIPPQASEYLRFVTLPDERIALMDNVNDKVYFIDSSGNLLAITNMLDTPDATLQNLDGVVVNNRLILSEDGDNHILQIDLDIYEGAIFRDLTSLPHWLGAITYSEGQYYVCGPQTIYAFSEGDDAVQIAEVPESNITGIVVIGNSAYVSVNFAGRIYKVDLSNGASSVFASDLNYPKDLERQGG